MAAYTLWGAKISKTWQNGKTVGSLDGGLIGGVNPQELKWVKNGKMVNPIGPLPGGLICGIQLTGRQNW